jgi:FixJ family two-component response regulator
MKKIIFIIDDEEDSRNALGWLIESWGYTVQTYADAEIFLATYKSNNFEQSGCLILDVMMPHITGFELQKELKRRSIELPIIFISGHGDIPMALHAMKTGSIDFLTKPINKQSLLEAINQAIKMHTQLVDKHKQKEAGMALVEKLTPREHEVMLLMIQCKPTKTIANTLNISLHTAELHRAKVMKKMKTKTLMDLIQLAVKYDLFINKE